MVQPQPLPWGLPHAQPGSALAMVEPSDAQSRSPRCLAAIGKRCCRRGQLVGAAHTTSHPPTLAAPPRPWRAFGGDAAHAAGGGRRQTADGRRRRGVIHYPLAPCQAPRDWPGNIDCRAASTLAPRLRWPRLVIPWLTARRALVADARRQSDPRTITLHDSVYCLGQGAVTASCWLYQEHGNAIP